MCLGLRYQFVTSSQILKSALSRYTTSTPTTTKGLITGLIGYGSVNSSSHLCMFFFLILFYSYLCLAPSVFFQSYFANKILKIFYMFHLSQLP
jgi:uncharacterized membrane protein